MEEKMTLKQLQLDAKRYTQGKMNQENFYLCILEYLETATPDDYMAFALWLVEQEKEQGH